MTCFFVNSFDKMASVTEMHTEGLCHVHTARFTLSVNKIVQHSKDQTIAEGQGPVFGYISGCRKCWFANKQLCVYGSLTQSGWEWAELFTQRITFKKKYFSKTIHLFSPLFIPQKCFLSPCLPHSEKKRTVTKYCRLWHAVGTKLFKTVSQIRRDAGLTCMNYYKD